MRRKFLLPGFFHGPDGTIGREFAMASPNYGGEKRRKDLAKQAKKKEKMARKLEKSRGAGRPSGQGAAEPAPESPDSEN